MVWLSDLRPGRGVEGAGRAITEFRKIVEWLSGLAPWQWCLGKSQPSWSSHLSPGSLLPSLWTCLTSQGPSLMKKCIVTGAQRTRTKWTHMGAMLSITGADIPALEQRWHQTPAAVTLGPPPNC